MHPSPLRPSPLRPSPLRSVKEFLNHLQAFLEWTPGRRLPRRSVGLELPGNRKPKQAKVRRLRKLGEVSEQDYPWPESGRLAGIDFGTVRIGVSICDPSRTWISPLETFHRQTPTQEAAHFLKLTREHQILGWVVGLPIHCDGRDSRKAQEARDFARWLSETTQRPVRFVDERYSTALATRLLRELELTHKQRKKQLDKIAAHIILDAYLESAKHPGFRPLTLENSSDAQISLD